MDKQSIIHSLKLLADEGEIEILSEDEKSITVWDNSECGKELTFYFREHNTYRNLAKRVFISPTIPKVYKPFFTKHCVMKTLLEKIDPNCFMTMTALFIVWDDNKDNETDKFRSKLEDLTDDEYAHEIGDGLLGITWWERNVCIISASQIIHTVLEMYEEDDYQFKEEVEIGFWTTVIHELRHLLLDTNIILPENEYPQELASEDNVEEYCRKHFENNF